MDYVSGETCPIDYQGLSYNDLFNDTIYNPFQWVYRKVYSMRISSQQRYVSHGREYRTACITVDPMVRLNALHMEYVMGRARAC